MVTRSDGPEQVPRAERDLAPLDSWRPLGIASFSGALRSEGRKVDNDNEHDSDSDMARSTHVTSPPTASCVDQAGGPVTLDTRYASHYSRAV